MNFVGQNDFNTWNDIFQWITIGALSLAITLGGRNR